MSLLSSRQRPSATPVRDRTSIQTQDVPQYQAPAAPLNENGQRALEALLQTHSTKNLNTYLDQATKVVTDTAGQINEIGSDAKEKFSRKRSKAEANGEEIDKRKMVKLDQLTGRVEGLTQRLDKTMRELIDSHVFLTDLPDVVTRVNPGSNDASTQLTTATFTQTQRSTRRRRLDNDDEDEDLNVEGEIQDSQQSGDKAPSPESAPSVLFQNLLESQATEWNSKTLRSRYSIANQYIGFYRVVHDAKNFGDNPPPVPHPSTWFAAEEDEDGSVIEEPIREDEEIEIAAERQSTRCPITLLPFQDPVTSTKCPHSFEREAIMSMMRRPQVSRSQRSQTQLLLKEVACPECNLVLTENDLRPDPALLRRVQRLLEAEARAREENSDDDDDDSEDAPRGTQRRAHTIGSSPAIASRDVRRIKQERRSVLSQVRATQGAEEVDIIPSSQMVENESLLDDSD